jgi:hypothetical protein
MWFSKFAEARFGRRRRFWLLLFLLIGLALVQWHCGENPLQPRGWPKRGVDFIRRFDPAALT